VFVFDSTLRLKNITNIFNQHLIELEKNTRLKFQKNFCKRDSTVDQFMNTIHKVYHCNSDTDC